MLPKFPADIRSLCSSDDTAQASHKSAQSPNQNAALNPKRSVCPIVSIEGLLRLVTFVAQHRATQDLDAQAGVVCQNSLFPPVSTASSLSTVVSVTPCPTPTISSRSHRDDERSDHCSGAGGTS